MEEVNALLSLWNALKDSIDVHDLEEHEICVDLYKIMHDAIHKLMTAQQK
jgi:hypothetical protein